MLYSKKRRNKIIVILEPSFDILINQNNSVMLILLARADIPQNPFIVYDRKKTLALFRDKREIIKLTEIPRKVLKVLKSTDEISITEMNEQSEPIRQYSARIIYDSQLQKKLKKEKKVLY